MRLPALLAPVPGILLILAACQDPQTEPIDPDLARTARTKDPRTLTVTGGGTGYGLVTAPFYGETEELSCTISGGTASPDECVRAYGWKTHVTVTATPQGGSTFTGWSGACSGTSSTCSVVMTQSRSVRASFAGSTVPRFMVTVAGGGTGSGTITSQTGVSPALSCTVTNGSSGSTGCSGSYLQGTSLVLTATPASGHTFAGWTGDCSGTGTCSFSVSSNKAVTANFNAPLGSEATAGRWEAPRTTPALAIHLNLLSNGKALLWGHYGEPYLWNPAGGGFTQVTANTCTDPSLCELFCAGHTYLADGRLLVAGGHNEALGDNHGIQDASIFDGASWQKTGSMAYKRWYPTLVTMDNGNVVAISGNQAGINTIAPVPERYNGSTWTVLSGINTTILMYPRAFVEPKNGHIFIAGEASPSRYLNPYGSGSITNGPARVVSDRNYAPAVMLDSKVLYIGGGGASGCPSNVPKYTAEIIDLAAASPVWSSIAEMKFGRRHHNATILADGKVLVTGGTSVCGFSNEAGAVFTAEMWNPATNTWSSVAPSNVTRVYHSTTMLLPDGRVFQSGSGEGAGTTAQYNYEIYSPPYLFKGARPTYIPSGTAMHYGQPFSVSTPNAASIRKVLLIRLASSTHAFDMGQRLNTVAFQVGTDGQSLVLTPPASGRIAPPGPYMLFIVNDQGVPSVAHIIVLSQ